MGRERTGTIVWIEPDASKGEERGHYAARITLNDGARPWVHFEPGPKSKTAYTSAKHRAHGIAEQARRDNLTAEHFGLKPPTHRTPRPVAVETVSDWWERYHDAAATGLVGRKNKGKPQVTIKNRRSRFRDYIEPHIGSTPMNAVTSKQIHEIVRALNALVRERASFFDRPAAERVGQKPGITAKTAQHIWSELRSGFREACTLGEDASLRVRDDNPTDRVAAPIRGDEREQAALYPDELTALLACDDVPMYRRVLYAVAAYTGARESELRALRARDVDLAHGLLTIRVQKKKNRGELTATKTRAGVREVPIHKHLVPLLEKLAEGLDDDEPLLRVPPAEDCAERMRDDLHTAECERPELFEDSAQRRPFTFHGLRHTCLTHWALTPGASVWTLHAAGHTDLQTSQRYVAMANVLRAGRFGEPHPPLPKTLLEMRSDSVWNRLAARPPRATRRLNSRFLATPMGIEPMLPA